ncbi:MAG: cytochrome c oxidase subunit II [Alphaproteobacteria bacterium]|nr:cytochrome c oxidase subunit II [Alphaproteobacteria bacterium]
MGRMGQSILSVIGMFLINLFLWTISGQAANESHVIERQDWQIAMPPAASPVMQGITEFHNILTIIAISITVFVLILLLWVIIRFREKANPEPSKTTHNTLLEVLWTAIPVLILVGIAIPSFRLLYFQDRTPNPELTLKAIGHQWYWSYQYPDQGNFTFDANMIPDAEIKPGQVRLLETDNPVVLPVHTKIRLLTTAADVVHSFALPSLGIKLDAVPGRLNETWMEINEPGTYYGQCSEICGDRHAFMPIMVKAVPKEEYQQWVENARKKFPVAEEESQ